MLYSQENKERRFIHVSGDPIVVAAIVDQSVHNISPTYPRLAKEAQREGNVAFDVFVSKEGKVKQLVLMTPESHPEFVSAAAQALINWNFKPVKYGNKYIPFVTRIEVKFVLSEKKKPAP